MTASYGQLQRSILVIDDDKSLCYAIDQLLRRAGYKVATTTTADEALERIAADHYDLALVDYRLPDGMQGHQLIRQLRAISPHTCFAAMTGYSSPEVANSMYDEGVAHYFQKPIQDLGRFLGKIKELIGADSVEGRVPAVVGDQNLLDHPAFSELIGISQSMLRIKREVLTVAPFEINVLIQGESGSGKGVLARAIHRASQRADGPFAGYNISAMPEGLVESILFGFEKGAFPNAYKRTPGLFEANSGGTVFLDEIGDLPLDQQVKLLTVIENQQVWRLGATSPTPIDVRILAATHVDLEAAVAEGSFRRDLYYRLNSLVLRVPPLRDRIADVPQLAWKELQRCNERFGRSIKKIEPEALDLLQSYPWGENNVRELHSVLHRIVVSIDPSSEVLRADDVRSKLPEETVRQTGPSRAQAPERATPATPSPSSASTGAAADFFDLPWSEANKACRDWFKKEFVLEQLRRKDWNITQAAKACGVNRSNFHRMMRDSGIDLSEKRWQKLVRPARSDDQTDT